MCPVLNLHSSAITELPWLPFLCRSTLLPLLVMRLLLLVQGGIEVAVLIGLHSIGEAATDSRRPSGGIGAIDVVAVQLLDGIISYDLGDLRQSVIGLQNREGL